MRERTNSLVFGGPLLTTPTNSGYTTPTNEDVITLRNIKSPSKNLPSPNNQYNISSKTNLDDTKYNERSQQIINHEERNELAKVVSNKGYPYGALGPSDKQIAEYVLSTLGTPKRKPSKAKTTKRKPSKAKTTKRKPSKLSIVLPDISKVSNGKSSKKKKKRKRGGSTKTKKRKTAKKTSF